MSEKLSLSERLSRVPLLSAAALVPGIICGSSIVITSEISSAGVTGLAASAVASVFVGGSAVKDMMDEKRSGLSKVFSGVAACTAASPFLVACGPELGLYLGILMLPFTSVVAGAFNLTAHATKNRGIKTSVARDDNTPPPPPAP